LCPLWPWLIFDVGQKNLPRTISFFRKKEEAKPELHQKEREAIVDLLHLCLYGDSHVALKEGAFISDVVDVIGWETQSSFGSYESRSIASARAAKENSDSKKEFLSAAAARLQSKPARAMVIDLCKQLLVADGSTADKEAALLGEIRAALK
jgi:uncharacterized tellurite resistance protein B-like protein